MQHGAESETEALSIRVMGIRKLRGVAVACLSETLVLARI